MNTKTEYFGVYENTIMLRTSKMQKANINYTAQLTIASKVVHKFFDNKRDAAIQVDKWLIQQGKQPKNILKPKPVN